MKKRVAKSCHMAKSCRRTEFSHGTESFRRAKSCHMAKSCRRSEFFRGVRPPGQMGSFGNFGSRVWDLGFGVRGSGARSNLERGRQRGTWPGWWRQRRWRIEDRGWRGRPGAGRGLLECSKRAGASASTRAGSGDWDWRARFRDPRFNCCEFNLHAPIFTPSPQKRTLPGNGK